MKKSVLMSVFAAISASTMATVTNYWVNTTVDNSPDSALDFFNEESWSESLNLDDDNVFLRFNVSEIDREKQCFINVSSPVVFSHLYSKNQNVFIGEKLTLKSTSTKLRPGITIVYGSYPAYFYNDIELSTFDAKMTPWIGGVNFAGNVHLENSNSDLIFSSGTPKFRADLFAPHSQEKREGMIKIPADSKIKVSNGNSDVEIYAPFGCSEHTIICSQKEGSPYLTIEGTPTDNLAVGTLVTGNGIAQGTYLKRVFPNKKYIELSESVTSTVDSNEIVLSSFTPDYHQYIPYFFRQGNLTNKIAFVKGRAQDKAVLEIGNISGAKCSTILGTATSISGTYLLHDLVTDLKTDFFLRNADIIFDVSQTGVVPGFSGSYSCFIQKSYSVNITATNNINALISKMEQLDGNIVKKGAGSLEVNLATLKAAGGVKVEEGKFIFSRHSSVASDNDFSLGSLEVVGGAELVINDLKLNVQKMVLNEGSRISGSGEIVIDESSIDSISKAVTIAPSVKLTMKTHGEHGNILVGDFEASIVGHPAFWVDASKPESIQYETINGTNFVVRWNDCRPGETMFCTNIKNRAQFINGDKMAKKYVRMGNHQEITSLKDSEMLVWSKPIYDVKAVFLVQDPSEGGGELLGRCSWRLGNKYYGSRGGPYYRDNSININTRIYLNSKYSTPSVIHGKCYLNGVDVSDSPFYNGRVMQLIEHHVNTNYMSGSSIRNLAADAFGAGYENVSDDNYNYIRRNNGGMRIAECIVFTNTLSYAERVKIGTYLMNKWLGKKMGYHYIDNSTQYKNIEIDSQNRIDFEVVDGTNILKTVSGAGTFAKSGQGDVVIDSFDGPSLDVKEGNVIINSLVSDSESLLSKMNKRLGFSPWLHVDAAKLASLQTSLGKDGKADVKRWDDVSGNNVRLEMLYANSTNYPHLEPNVLNSLPMVDFGVRGSSKPADKNNPLMVYVKSDGTKYERTDSGVDSPKIKTSFFVANSSGGGNSLLGSDNNGYPYLGFPNYALGKPILSVTTKFVENLQTQFGSANKWTFRKNGEDYNPFETPFSLGNDLFLFHSANPSAGRCGITFGGVWSYNDNVGGLKYGEIMLYQESLSSSDWQYIEAYMQNKWFNRKTKGVCVASVSNLYVASGSTVNIVNGNEINVDGLSGGGTINADKVNVSENAVFKLDIKPGALADTLKVDGAVVLPSKCTLKVTGALDEVTQGFYTVLTATSIIGEDVVWSFDTPEKPLRTYTVTNTGSALCVSINQAATILILK